MEYINTLPLDISLRKYVNDINNISDEPISSMLLNDLIDLSLSKYINHYVLIKFNIITKKTNVANFLKLYMKPIVSDGQDFYITNNEFKTILSYESQMLYEHYLSVLRYIRQYKKYQERLSDLLYLRNRYNKLDAILLDVKDQITKINSISTQLLARELEDLTTIEKEIEKMKLDISSKLLRLQ